MAAIPPQPTCALAMTLAARGLAVQRVARREERAIEREWTRHLGADRMRALHAALAALRPITDPYIDLSRLPDFRLRSPGRVVSSGCLGEGAPASVTP